MEFQPLTLETVLELFRKSVAESSAAVFVARITINAEQARLLTRQSDRPLETISF
jgi:hypothetical protein